MSSNFFIDVLHFILTYPSFYPHISSSYPAILSLLSCYFIPFILLFYPFYLLFYPFYPAILSLYPAIFIPFILTFILLVIRSGSGLIRIVAVCCLIGPSFACPAQEQGKPLCFYFPAPRCGHRCLPLLAAPAPGPSLQRHGLPLLPAPPGIGGGAGVGGSGERGRR